MELIGKTTINPFIFYSGKISGYLTWIILILLFSGIELIDVTTLYFNNYISAYLVFVGLFFIVISLANLGKSTRLGLPSDDTDQSL
jgi:hypothetical protein